MVKRIRGVAYSMKVSPQSTNRMVCMHKASIVCLPSCHSGSFKAWSDPQVTAASRIWKVSHTTQHLHLIFTLGLKFVTQPFQWNGQ